MRRRKRRRRLVEVKETNGTDAVVRNISSAVPNTVTTYCNNALHRPITLPLTPPTHYKEKTIVKTFV